MKNQAYTGLAHDDRRIAAELQAMGAFDQPMADEKSTLANIFETVGEFITWMRWKGEVGVYGCRVAADHARKLEAMAA